METYPIIDEQKRDGPFAFEIENAYIGPRTIARLLNEIDGVSDVHARRPFSPLSEIQVEFTYCTQPYVVWEPYGDNSRYWIGPKEPAVASADIGEIESAFRHYRPPVYRRWLGDILSLKFITRFFRRRADRSNET
jgi:hypothetical protein